MKIPTTFQALLTLAIFLAACTPTPSSPSGEVNLPLTFTPTEPLTPTSTPALTAEATFTPTPTFTASPTSTATATSTITPTPTLTPTSTITPTPTYAFPQVVVNAQAHCRYGPSKAYLHAADLFAGDQGVVWGRFRYSSWLLVKFDKLSYECWVSPSVLDITGDISLINYKTVDLVAIIPSVLYGPPQNVRASRSGNQVTITWDPVWMTEDDDRGYFIEAWVCQNGGYIWWTVSFPNQYITTYTVQDDAGCPQASKGEIYAVEKHGYTTPVKIPWP